MKKPNNNSGLPSTQEAFTYIIFEPAPPKPKTKVWWVLPRDDTPIEEKLKFQIGTVQWYGPWRKYCFMPARNTVFEQVCLREIAQFCEQQTNAHRALARSRAQARVDTIKLNYEKTKSVVCINTLN